MVNDTKEGLEGSQRANMSLYWPIWLTCGFVSFYRAGNLSASGLRMRLWLGHLITKHNSAIVCLPVFYKSLI